MILPLPKWSIDFCVKPFVVFDLARYVSGYFLIQLNMTAEQISALIAFRNAGTQIKIAPSSFSYVLALDVQGPRVTVLTANLETMVYVQGNDVLCTSGKSSVTSDMVKAIKKEIRELCSSVREDVP